MLKISILVGAILLASNTYAANCGNDKDVGNADCNKPIVDPRNPGDVNNSNLNNNLNSNINSNLNSNTNFANSESSSLASSLSNSSADSKSTASLHGAVTGNFTGGNSTATSTLNGGNSSVTSSLTGGSSTSTADSHATGGKAIVGDTISKSSVGNVSSTIASDAIKNTNTLQTGTQNVTISTVDPNSVEVAKINAEAATADRTIKNTPDVYSPPLTSSNDSCMGSSSGGVTAPGFGLSLGSTWVDENCKRLKNSRELWNRGYKSASMAMMCNDPEIREALEITGFMCPPKKPVYDTSKQ